MENKAIQQVQMDTLICRPQVRERFDEESLTSLAQTIKETGILQPLLVRREGPEFVVLEGERRMRAAKMAGLSQVPVVVDDRELCDAEVVYRQLVVNCSRQGLQPLETARGIDKLMREAQWTASEAAVKLGMSPAKVSRLLALLTLPESVQKQVESGAIPPSTAYEISRAGNVDEQEQLAREAANGRLTRDRVVGRKKERKTKRRRSSGTRSKRRVNRIVLPIGDGCSLSIADRELTLPSFTTWLSDLLNRMSAVEPKDMALADAVRLVTTQSE